MRAHNRDVKCERDRRGRDRRGADLTDMVLRQELQEDSGYCYKFV